MPKMREVFTMSNRALQSYFIIYLLTWLSYKLSRCHCEQVFVYDNNIYNQAPSSVGANFPSHYDNINKFKTFNSKKVASVNTKPAQSPPAESQPAALFSTDAPTITANPNSPLKRRICYYANWAPYRELDPPLYPDKIDPALCTHIHFAFAKIDSKNFSILPTEEHDINWTQRSNMPLYIRLYGLKRRNANLKIMLAIGGWSARSDGFNYATKTAENRSKFINETINYLREWNFDGVDLDWEYPGDVNQGADSSSKDNFNDLVNEFRTAVELEATEAGKRQLLISSAVAADPNKIDSGYYVSNLCAKLDYISVMSYDYHGIWDEVTGLNSPLYSRNSNDDTYDKWKNANYSINYWISNGCPPEKINFGLAAYGRSFTLRNSSVNTVGAPAVRGGLAGSYTREEGIYSYYEICEKLNVDGWKKHLDEKQQSLYATHWDQWVGFDNQRSIALKVKWAYTMSLGGTMFWTLDFDDYTGQFCHEGPFPLANAIKAVFDEYSPTVPSSKTTATTTTTTTSSNKKQPIQNHPSGRKNSSTKIMFFSNSSKIGYINIIGNNITDRRDHLNTLLSYLHPILQRQQLDYRIFVAEQSGNGTFNKAIIMNAGFIYAFDQDNYNCYCFHDVDLVPEDDRNMYSCGRNPKHMSIGVDEMNYKLQYEELIGGVLILRTEHLLAANGYSNLYWGWGAEDDDLYYRLKGLNYKIERPPLKIGRYKMMKHEKRKPQLWSKRAKLLYSSVNRMTWDGISSAKYTLLNVTVHKSYTHLLIDVGKPPAGFQ